VLFAEPDVLASAEQSVQLCDANKVDVDGGLLGRDVHAGRVLHDASAVHA
jgi:hypothetical protein